MNGTQDKAPSPLAEAPLFAGWPKTPDGRLLCSPEHPMPIHIGDAHNHRWAHTNFHEVGQQRDGWPAGDIVTKKCDDCGIVVEAELPQ
jgi:hypothetical protein